VVRNKWTHDPMNKRKKIKERIRRSDLFLFYQLNILMYILNTVTKMYSQKINFKETSHRPIAIQLMSLHIKMKYKLVEQLAYQTIIGKIKYKLLDIIKQFKKLDYKRWSMQWITKIMNSSSAFYKIRPIVYLIKKKINIPVNFALYYLCQSIIHKNIFYKHLAQSVKPQIHKLLIDKEAICHTKESLMDEHLWFTPIRPTIVPTMQHLYRTSDKKLDSHYGWTQEYDRSTNNPFVFDIDIKKLQQLKSTFGAKSFFFSNELYYNICTYSILQYLKDFSKE